MFIDENDYLLTKDNKKIINNLCYNPKYGIIHFIDNMGSIEWYDSNNSLVEIEESDYYDTVQLYLSNGTIYNDKLSSIILLDIFVFLTIKKFYSIKKISGILLIPYFIWVLFATYLNTGYLFLN